jgi:hypothetical protein
MTFGERMRAAQHGHTRAGAYGTRTRTQIYSIIAPADGTRCNGDFGTSAFFGQLLDKPLLACI